MTRIEADPGGLVATSRALLDATAVARAVHGGSRTLADAAAATGSPLLEDAVDGFRRAWAHGLGLVVDDASTLAGMLAEAAAAYRDVEGGIAGACRP
jgi:hypothetical protein